MDRWTELLGQMNAGGMKGAAPDVSGGEYERDREV